MQDPAPTMNARPVVSPTPPASTTPKMSPATQEMHREKCGKDCDQCLKGGMPMKREWLSFVVILLIGLSTLLTVLYVNEKRKTVVYAPTVNTEEPIKTEKVYEMPAMKALQSMVDLPVTDFEGSLESVIASRRSRRVFAETPLTLAHLNSVLWAAQGITDVEHGYRTAPSAKSAYPYTVYVVARNVEGLEPGLYEYVPDKNQLGSLGIANAGEMLTSAGVQDGAQKAPAVLLLAAAPAKMLAVFPDSDPMKNVYLEGGHIGQNIYLEVESLGLATVVMGGFDPMKVNQALNLDSNEQVVYIVPVGNRGE